MQMLSKTERSAAGRRTVGTSRELTFAHLFGGTLLLLFAIDGDSVGQAPSRPPQAGNSRVEEILKTFPGRGVMADGSVPTPPNEAETQFRMHDGFKMELMLSEPVIEQPLFLSWDSKGRMWVVQYRQYQYPAGLKVVRFDQHLRAVFDRVPEPPPHGPQGADRITVHEDTDGDGKFDRHQVVLSGLNIATAVQTDDEGIWVLNPPYLLYYPDHDQDDRPDGEPEVHLSGFGLQDTHSVANSLLWGPDGWLYGANGSTTGGTVSSRHTKGVKFQGQCIWRYHPHRETFEIYAEGGGNTFSCEIDAAGRLFSGTNAGATRGLYYPQGAYFRKNWGKHGPLTNPYAFGFFEHMKSKGDARRFPQAMLIYDGGLYASEFKGRLFAANAMTNTVLNSRLIPDGSAYHTVDEPALATTDDHWFRPVYAGVGADGCVYTADWYDSRLSHVSPTDDWHKTSGRVYRIRPTGRPASYSAGDLHRIPTAELLNRLEHPNKWVRQRATLEIGWRKERSLLPKLIRRVELNHVSALESLWAINLLDELSIDRCARWLHHDSPDVRRWVVRLMGDRREGHPQLAKLASSETNLQVRSQLASTAKRVPTQDAFAILSALLNRNADLNDPHLPLLIWWAVEEHADDWPRVQALVGSATFQQSSVASDFLLRRLARRYAASADPLELERISSLLALTPKDRQAEVIQGMIDAYAGRKWPDLPAPLEQALSEYRISLGQHPILEQLRRREPAAIKKAPGLAADRSIALSQRLEIISELAQTDTIEVIQPLLTLATRSTPEPSLQRAAIRGLASFKDAQIAERLTKAFDNSISAEHGLRDTACRTLASRGSWARVLLREINAWRIRPSQIPHDVVQILRAFPDEDIQQAVNQAFGRLADVAAPEKIAEIERLTKLLESTTDLDPNDGHKIYAKHCATCHQLFGEGKRVGPPLDNYDRGNLKFWLPAIVDPSLEIREGYQTYAATTKDARVITGTIANQNPQTITLITAENHPVIIARTELETLRALKQSLMPENLLATLNDQQIANLFAYLRLGTQR